MFSSLNDAWGHDPIKDMTNKISRCQTKECLKQLDSNQSELQSDIYNFKNNSITASRGDTINLTDSSINLATETPIKKKKVDLSFLNSDNYDDTECVFNVEHLKNCNKCYSKVKKLIDSKVSNKIKDKKKDFLSDSWKETLIIICGAIIALFLIFLISKSIN